MSKLSTALGLLFSNPIRLIKKIQLEFSAPSTSLTSVLRRLYCLCVPGKMEVSSGNAGRLLFVYDTLLNPVTFDFLHYLYFADWLRRRSGYTQLDLLLVYRSRLEVSREESYIAAVGADNIYWRLTNLIVPLSRLFSSVGRIYVVDEQQAFELAKNYRNVHPEGYSYSSPKSAVVKLNDPDLTFFPALTVSDTARKIIEAYFPASDARRIVTITLRSYDYIAVRNSDIASWVAFASQLDSTKFRVVFVPDASAGGVATFADIGNFEIFDSACWNIELRAGLYQRAWINMGVACGPLAISGLLEGTRTVMIDRSLDYPTDYLASILSVGVTPGERIGFYNSSCHFVLGKDNKETISKLFDFYAQ